jgi:CheY-like chemotaxis protein
LREIGYDTAVAYDAPGALRVASDFHPAAALLDIGLPVMDGYELAQQLKRIPDLEHIPLIAITGYGQEADRARAQRVGFDRHFVKPVDFEAVRQSLAELVH